MKVSKILLNIASVVCFIYGALYVFSLVFIPVGIYCFLAGKRFSYKAERLDDVYFMSKKEFKAYTIFTSIACFPLGLLVIIPYLKLTGNNVKITDTQGIHIQEENVSETKDEEVKENEVEIEAKPVEVQKDEDLSEVEKQVKFKKLQNFRDKGIITDEELEQARKQLFGE